MIEIIKVESEINTQLPKPELSKQQRLQLLVLLGMVLGMVAAYLISQGLWVLALAAVASVPVIVWVSKHPFSGVLLWLLVMPFASALPSSNLVYWVIYRLMPPFLLGLAVLSRTRNVREHPPARLGPPELTMIILVAFVPLSILFTQADPSLALIRFSDRMILPFCLYLVVRLLAPRAKEFAQLQWVALFIAFTQSAIGLLSWYAPQVLPEVWHYLNGERTTGSVRDPDLYALVLTFAAIILIHAAVNKKSGMLRWLFYLASGLCAIFTILSLERAAWLGGILVTLGLLILFPKIMIRLVIIGGIAIAILGAGIFSTHLSLSINRFSESDPVYDRLVVFDAMTQMVAQKPVFGWGYETLDQNIQSFYRRVGEASISTRLVTSHNTYMTVLTELGLTGFILYMFPVAWWFILSIRVWRRIPKEGFWSRSLLASLWLIMLFNFTVSNFFDMRWFEIGLTLWWLVLGLIANMVYPYLKGRQTTPAVQPEMENSHG